MWRIIQHARPSPAQSGPGLFERLTRTPPTHTHTHEKRARPQAVYGWPRRGPLGQSRHCHSVPRPISALSLRVAPPISAHAAVKSAARPRRPPGSYGGREMISKCGVFILKFLNLWEIKKPGLFLTLIFLEIVLVYSLRWTNTVLSSYSIHDVSTIFLSFF